MEQLDAKKAIDQIFPQYKQDLAKLVSIGSVNDKAQGKAPFGPNILKMLETTLEIAKGFGFKTYIDPDGYYGYAEVGEGKELFGVLGHLDVVPVGDRSVWKTNPFEMVEKDGRLYGRGTQDDKGPTLASMYAMKILLDHGAKLKMRVRYIFGTDEESLWRGIKAYAKKEEHPTLGFTPDSSFPLIYAEKGLVEYNLICEEKTDITMKGGSAFNAVAGSATVPFNEKIEDALKELKYEYRKTGDEIEVVGKSVHAKDTEKGINAIVRLAEAMVKAGMKNDMLRFIVEKGNDPLGTPIFGKVEDEMSGPLKFNIGLLDMGKEKQTLGVDIRIPVTYDKAKVDAKLAEAAAPYNIKVEEFDYLRSIYIDVKSDFIQALLKAYQDVTGDTKTEPISSGGATFARSMDNIVAFGATLPGQEKTEHQPNEFAVIEDLKIAMEIYIRAFENLVTEG